MDDVFLPAQEGACAWLARLERLASYEGAWRTLRDETPRLKEAIRELREREERLDDLLVVALVGGSGVGKSTLLNALAGDQLAATSDFRPCTSVPTVYHPPGTRLHFEGWRHVSGSALERLVLIDTPDSDTVVREHRAIVEQALTQCDLILLCGSPEKYLDEATWSLLRDLKGERAIVCIETKAQAPTAGHAPVRAHWLGKLKEHDFAPEAYFRVNALRALDRKLTGGPSSPEEVDFPALESFLREELDREQVRRIKRSNVMGLLRRTFERTRERIGARLAELETARKHLDVAREAMTILANEAARARLFAEPHLWAFAMGREIAVRAKGLTGTMLRIVEALRSLPVRLMGRRASAARQAAALLLAQDEPHAFIELAQALKAPYENRRSEVTLALVQAGFDRPAGDDDFAAFQADLERRLANVLQGPAHERLVRSARRLTAWIPSLLADIPPVAFLACGGYTLCRDFLLGVERGTDFFLHAGVVLALLLGFEVAVILLFARFSAWRARNAALRALHLALASPLTAFENERTALDEAIALASEAATLHLSPRQP